MKYIVTSVALAALIFAAYSSVNAMQEEKGNGGTATPKVIKLLNRGIIYFPAYGEPVHVEEGYSLVLYDLDDIASNKNLTALRQRELNELKMKDANAHQVLYMYSGPGYKTLTTIPFKKKSLEVPYTYSFAYGLQFNVWA